METVPIGSRERITVIAVTLCLAVGLPALATTEFVFGGDADSYVTLARQIATGQSYSVFGIPEVQFPPGYPAALAPAALVAGGSFKTINRWAALLAALAFPITWLYARRRVGWLGLPVALLTTGSVIFLFLATGNPVTEPFYLALTMALLLWAERGDATDTVRWGWVLAGAALLVVIPAVRTIGLAAVAAAGATLVLDAWRRPVKRAAEWARRTAPVLAGVAGLVAWFIWTSTARAPIQQAARSRSYFSFLLVVDPANPDLGHVSLLGFLARLGRNAAIEVAHAGELLSSVPWIKPAWYTPAVILVPLFLLGWLREYRSGARFAALYFLSFAGILLVWPFDEGARFLLPLVPLFWIYLFRGAGEVATAVREERHWVRLMPFWIGAIALTGAATARPKSRQDLVAIGFWVLVLALGFLGWRPLRRWIAGWTPRRSGTAVWVGVAIFLVVSGVQAGPAIYRRAFPGAGAIPQPGLVATEWIREHTSPNAVIQSTFPRRIMFLTGRPAVPLPKSRHRAVQEEIQARFRPEYAVVLDSARGDAGASDATRFEVVKALAPGRWREVHSFPGGRIYEFR